MSVSDYHTIADARESCGYQLHFSNQYFSCGNNVSDIMDDLGGASNIAFGILER